MKAFKVVAAQWARIVNNYKNTKQRLLKTNAAIGSIKYVG